MNELLAAALQYAGRGWHVFPLHSMRDGKCSCRQECGRNAGKHPRIKGGFKSASVDRDTIEQWWEKWPDANVGIATGRVSGLVVFDVDSDGGLATLKQVLQGAAGDVETGVSALTGVLTEIAETGRGIHIYFAVGRDRPAPRNSSGGGLDVRGDGGYVVAPPSNHRSGTTYRWRRDT